MLASALASVPLSPTPPHPTHIISAPPCWPPLLTCLWHTVSAPLGFQHPEDGNLQDKDPGPSAELGRKQAIFVE